ncbi:hypothetical protein VTO73DRAFT_13527 [Trametes versicolor]
MTPTVSEPEPGLKLPAKLRLHPASNPAHPCARRDTARTLSWHATGAQLTIPASPGWTGAPVGACELPCALRLYRWSRCFSPMDLDHRLLSAQHPRSRIQSRGDHWLVRRRRADDLR